MTRNIGTLLFMILTASSALVAQESSENLKAEGSKAVEESRDAEVKPRPSDKAVSQLAGDYDRLPKSDVRAGLEWLASDRELVRKVPATDIRSQIPFKEITTDDYRAANHSGLDGGKSAIDERSDEERDLEDRIPQDADATEEDLARQLSNPVAALISVPIVFSYDGNIGPTREGGLWKLQFQPVIPMSLNDDWNLISRTIIPIVFQKDIPIPGAGKNGLGDIVQTFFFSPAKAAKITWGAGPVVLLPTATNQALGAGKLGVGPSVLVLTQPGSFTVGALWNHIWSVAGSGGRPGISTTFLQPFFSYNTKSQTTFGINTESTYDFKRKNWSVPINIIVSQLTRIGSQMVQFRAGPRYYAASNPNGPRGWGFQTQLVLLFPR